MNTKAFVQALLFSGFRLLGATLMIGGLLSLIIRISETWYHFDPNYLGNFAFQTCFRPSAYFLTGVLVYLCARSLSACAARSFRESAD